MMQISKTAVAALLMSTLLAGAHAGETSLPDAILAPGETIVLTLHAEGAQIYECKAGTDGSSPGPFVSRSRR